MKLIKNVFLAILKVILVDLIILLIFSFTFKDVIVDGIIKETIVQNVIKKEVKENNTIDISNYLTDNEQVNEILESKEIQELINKYLDITINNLTDEEDLSEIDIEKDFINYLRENKEVIENLTGQEVTDEMIDETQKQMQEKDVNLVLKQNIRNAKNNLTKKEKVMLKGYKFVISTTFKIILFLAIFVDLILISILQKSLFKWILTLTKAIFISGISIIILSIAMKIIISNIYNYSNFNTMPLALAGIYVTLIGLIFSAIYYVVEKIIKTRGEE